MTTPPYQPGPYGPPGQYGQRPGGYGPHPGGRPAPPPAQPHQQPHGRPSHGQQPYGQQRPYAQQPPYGQHSGGGYQPPPTARPFQPQSPPPPRPQPPPEPPRNNHTAMVVVIVALLVLIGAGTAVFLMAGDGKPDTAAGPQTTAGKPAGTSAPAPTGDAPAGPGAAIDAKVGDCIKVNDVSATEADIETIDCADPAAVYKIGVREEDSTGQCPSPNYVSYTEDGVLLLCMTLNARKGECFHETDQQDTRVACDSPDASYKVGEIVEGTADSNRCGTADAENALTYPKPPLTICRLSIE